MTNKSAMGLFFPRMWITLRLMSHFADCMNIFLAVAARVRSLVAPEFKIVTTAWLCQAGPHTLSATKMFSISKCEILKFLYPNGICMVYNCLSQ